MADFSARLYLITPRIRSASDIEASLSTALAAGDVACVLLRIDPDSPVQARRDAITRLADLVQARGAALLIEDDGANGSDLPVDGVHVEHGGGNPARIRSAAKPDRILGVGGLTGRDDAMVAGESGADYLMFGEPDASGDLLSLDERLEQVAWWAEIFQVPCVAFAGALSEVEAFAEAGAEFVALCDTVWNDARSPGAAVADVLRHLAEGSRRYLVRAEGSAA